MAHIVCWRCALHVTISPCFNPQSSPLSGEGTRVAKPGRTPELLTGGDGSGAQAVKDVAVRGARDVIGGDARILSILPEKGGLKQSTIRSNWGHGRNILNALASDAMIAVDGGAGTLSEVAFAQMAGRRVVLFGNARETLKGIVASMSDIIRDAAAHENVLPVRCTEENVKAYAAKALETAFTTSDIEEAVRYAMAAEPLAFLPAVEGVDPGEYQRLLRRYGRETDIGG